MEYPQSNVKLNFTKIYLNKFIHNLFLMPLNNICIYDKYNYGIQTQLY